VWFKQSHEQATKHIWMLVFFLISCSYFPLQSCEDQMIPFLGKNAVHCRVSYKVSSLGSDLIGLLDLSTLFEICQQFLVI
jgi:hypothetical protein